MPRPKMYKNFSPQEQKNFDIQQTQLQAHAVVMAFLLDLPESLHGKYNQDALLSRKGQLVLYSEVNNEYCMLAKHAFDEFGPYVLVRQFGPRDRSKWYRSEYDIAVYAGEITRMLIACARNADTRVLEIPGSLKDPRKLEEARLVAATKGIW